MQAFLTVRLFIKSISLLILLLLCSIPSFAQTIEEKLKEADEYFETGLYIEAGKLYSKILPTRNRDYDLNFKYGTCLLYSSHDKSDAISHLQHAVKSPSIDKRAYFFMGRAYHLNYQFKEAEKYYNMFREQGSSGHLKDHDVEA
ncbi:MAG: tetratricopeptide (TPR) repeat protein, partial [Vicingaceae bacterium]